MDPSRHVGWESGKDGARLALARVACNSFYVLELSPRASQGDIGLAATRLRTALSRGESGAASYLSPLGPQARTIAMVEVAILELSDPDRRIKHEIWYAGSPSGQPRACAGGWAKGLSAFGWTRR